jgi:hypothetical protein
MGRSEAEFTIQPIPGSRQLPMLLSREEVKLIFDSKPRFSGERVF